MSKQLEVSNLCIRLRHTVQPVVKDVSFTLRCGRVLAIVGESGSGKTIICKALMQLLRPERFVLSGSIRYRETELLTLSEKRIREFYGSKIAMIVQNPMTAFNPTIRIGAQMVETLRAHRKISKKDAYAVGLLALEKMNLPHCELLMNSYSYTLSGGMLQRIMIAMSLLHELDILIADEVTTALDVKNQRIVLDELKQTKKRGVAVLLVTHDFAVAAALADDMIVMRAGEIIEGGPVSSIFAQPQEAYTRELLRASMLTKGNSHV